MDASVQSAIVAAANSLGVDPNLALAVANQESGGNQNAISPAGAIGIFQLMPKTAAGLGVDPTDAGQNIQGGITFLKQMLSQFGQNVSEALAAYNWGPGNLTKAIAAYGSNWLSYAPAETQNYVSSILSAVGMSTSPLSLLPDLSNLSSVPSWLWLAGAGVLATVLAVSLS